MIVSKNLYILFIIYCFILLSLSIKAQENAQEKAQDESINIKQELIKIRNKTNLELDKLDTFAQDKIFLIKKNQIKKIEALSEDKEQIAKTLKEFENEFEEIKNHTFSEINKLFHQNKSEFQSLINNIDSNSNIKIKKMAERDVLKEMGFIKSRIKNISSFFIQEINRQKKLRKKLELLAQDERNKNSQKEIKETIRKTHRRDLQMEHHNSQ
ncbi:MAG: hypothetical protein HQK51_12040 [Oligoflexia bacterium]|nr:hypothetical protein [Oligoflexia bacterium]